MKIKNLEIKGGNQEFADKIEYNNFSVEDNEILIRRIIELYASTNDKDKLLNSLNQICHKNKSNKVKSKFLKHIYTFINSAIKQFGKQIITEGFKLLQ